MRYSCYQWNPKRFHPDFNGIASRYSGVKRDRLSQQKRRKQLESDHCYTLNLNQSLDKTLESRVQQLYKLQQARERHLNDIKLKEQLNQQRRRQIQSLREKNNQTKRQNKRNLELARKNLIEKNQHSRIKLRQNLQQMNEKMQKQMDNKKMQKSLRYKLVKQDQQLGHSRVNDYYREKNKQSVQLYLQMMQEENKKKRDEQKRIKRYEKQLKVMNKTVMTKKDYLNKVESEINKLRTNIKGLSSISKLKKKNVKMTEGSQDEMSPQSWKKELKKINPEQSHQFF